MKRVTFYLSGSIKKGNADDGKLCWGDSEKEAIRKGLEGFEVVFLDPQLGGKHLEDPMAAFGHDMALVASSDFVLVDAREKRGLGVGAEMVAAKLRGIPLVSIVPRNSHYHRGSLNYLGTEVKDYMHPFVFSLSDAVVEDLAGAIDWIKGQLKSPKPVKGIGVMEEAIKRHRDRNLDGEKELKVFLPARR